MSEEQYTEVHSTLKYAVHGSTQYTEVHLLKKRMSYNLLYMLIRFDVLLNIAEKIATAASYIVRLNLLFT